MIDFDKVYIEKAVQAVLQTAPQVLHYFENVKNKKTIKMSRKEFEEFQNKVHTALHAYTMGALNVVPFLEMKGGVLLDEYNTFSRQVGDEAAKRILKGVLP